MLKGFLTLELKKLALQYNKIYYLAYHLSDFSENLNMQFGKKKYSHLLIFKNITSFEYKGIILSSNQILILFFTKRFNTMY